MTTQENGTGELARLREALYEIANRASNMLDRDAAEWMPSIYKIACEAVGENPERLLSLSRPPQPDMVTDDDLLPLKEMECELRAASAQDYAFGNHQSSLRYERRYTALARAISALSAKGKS